VTVQPIEGWWVVEHLNPKDILDMRVCVLAGPYENEIQAGANATEWHDGARDIFTTTDLHELEVVDPPPASLP
jgi:hypothetical protein